MSQERFILLGHGSPLGTYPAPVVPVGRLGGTLVAAYSTTDVPGSVSEMVPIGEDCQFVIHTAELNNSLTDFDYRFHRLFAMDKSHVQHYAITEEREFFLRLLRNPIFSKENPFLRLSLAKGAKDVAAIENELTHCISVIAHSTPSFLETWLEGERQALGELGAEDLTHILNFIEELSATYGDSGATSDVTSKEAAPLYPSLRSREKVAFVEEQEFHRTKDAQTKRGVEGYAHNTDFGILSAIGKTPLVELKNIFQGSHFRLFAKLEFLNPSGSTKDRPAKRIIEQGIESGLITPGTVIVESSSGNMGIGLAQVCAVYGLRFVCVVDPKTTAQNLQLLKVYGAEVDMVKEPDLQTGEFLQARIKRVEELLRSFDNSFWPNQHSNMDNPLAHHQTMHEIYTELGGHLDYLFCATSTCGTIRGCSEYLWMRRVGAKVIAVDAKGSVIFGGARAKRLIPGHGAAVRPELFMPNMVDECVHVTDVECVLGCRRLVRQEGILAGGSSGAVLMALEHFKHHIPSGSTCVAILADRGERYLDTIYSDEWVMSHFGALERLWPEPLTEISLRQSQSVSDKHS